MKKIVDYKIVLEGDEDLSEVEKNVKGEIEKGWQPIGAPFFGGKDNSFMLQAMVKYENQ